MPSGSKKGSSGNPVDRQAADDFHKVEAFLRDHLGALYCDACLAATTGLDKVRTTNAALNLGPGIRPAGQTGRGGGPEDGQASVVEGRRFPPNLITMHVGRPDAPALRAPIRRRKGRKRRAVQVSSHPNDTLADGPASRGRPDPLGRLPGVRREHPVTRPYDAARDTSSRGLVGNQAPGWSGYGTSRVGKVAKVGCGGAHYARCGHPGLPGCSTWSCALRPACFLAWERPEETSPL